jgi:hypothetical protein
MNGDAGDHKGPPNSASSAPLAGFPASVDADWMPLVGVRFGLLQKVSERLAMLEVAPLEQVVLNGKAGGGGARGDAQLAIERGGMAVDGAQTDHQMFGDLGIGPALGE